MSLASCLDQSAKIERNTPVKDAIGGINPGWSLRFAAVPCTIWPASVRTVETYATLDSVAEFEMCTAIDIGCTTQDRVTINGKIYYVVGYQPFANAQFSAETPFITVLGKRNQP
jgi:hypothetical protein